jgi:hypothetical protein
MEASRIEWRSASAEPVRPALPIPFNLPLFISLTLPSPPFADPEQELKTLVGETLELARMIWYTVYFTYGILIY